MDMEKQQRKVSVIIPVYNTADYLPQCLDSLMNQTLENIEILCVDDGSSDRSPEIIREYQKKDPRIRLICQQNLGGGAARNRGMQEAAGEYLSFLDSDDYFEPTMLQEMAECMDRTESDICVVKVRFWHEDLGIYTDEVSAMREEFLPEKEVFSWQDMPGYIFNTFHNWPWNKMFRRSFVQEKGLTFQEIRRTNDLFFTCTALVNAKKITTLKKPMVNYRVGITGNCQSTNRESPLDFYQAFRKLKAYLEEQGIYAEVKQSFVNHALDGCLANLISLENAPSQQDLFWHLRTEIFGQLGIVGQPREYFYEFNQRMYSFYRTIIDEDYNAFLRQRIQDLKEERDRCILNGQKDIAAVREEKEEIYSSFSYRTGSAVTAPLRALGRTLRPKK
jgi:glycosyltransferase involved in cell wall biosynthesis